MEWLGCWQMHDTNTFATSSHTSRVEKQLFSIILNMHFDKSWLDDDKTVSDKSKKKK